MKLTIKNMVCNRCIMVVRDVMGQNGFTVENISLGEVQLRDEIDDEAKIALNKQLTTYGFELIDDRKSTLIAKIKSSIIELVHNHDSYLATNLSDFLAALLHHDYAYLSALFSEVEGTTIEKYFIAQKIEKVKELLKYDELSLSEIALKLNYSSTAHLSNQFKKVTGLSPSYFKSQKSLKRQSLDEL